MCRMPESYSASYVGRLAPPGTPNTTSTPSFLRHSMMASTARTGETSCYAGETCEMQAGKPAKCESTRGLARRLQLRRDGLAREVEVAPAALAHLVGDRHDRAALLAAAPQLPLLPAREDRRQQADDRQHRADDEPEEERAALDLAHHARRQPEEEGQHDVLESVAGHALPEEQHVDDRDDRQDDEHGPQERRGGGQDDLEQDPAADQRQRYDEGLADRGASCFLHSLHVLNCGTRCERAARA